MKGDGERYIQARIVMNVYSCLGNPQGNKFMPYPRSVDHKIVAAMCTSPAGGIAMTLFLGF